jgi:two-component system chemotaxis response regulator CheB
MTDIRVLIAEDSPTVRWHLKTLLEEAGLRVVGMAQDGEQVVSMVEDLKPDVISMDIRMPRVDGLEATRRIMARTPTPVVIVSGMLETEIDLSLQALEAGALAVVSKPPDRQNPEFPAKRQQLATMLRAMAGVRVIARREFLRPSLSSSPPPAARVSRRMTPEIVAVGASTGGPGALHQLLQMFPANFPLPIAIVQHMPHEFIGGLVRWLSSNTALTVQIAEDEMRLAPGQVVIAPGDVHLKLERRGAELITRLVGEKGPYRYQPSVDVLFESVAKICGSAAVGVILTGMGEDGAAGLLTMRQQGAPTFAQDEASSTVFGMPGAAMMRGAVERLEPLSNIAPEVLKLV